MSEREQGLAKPTNIILVSAFALAGPVLSIAPLGMAPLLIAAAILAMVAERLRAGVWPNPPAISIVLSTMLIIWCALTLIWDIKPGDGARKLLDLVVIFAALLALLGLALRMSDGQRRALSLALIGGVAVGLVLLYVEAGLDFPLYRAAMGNANPRLEGGVEAKRSIDAMPLVIWPAAFALARLGRTWPAVILVLLFTASCVVLTAASATMGMAFALFILAAASLSMTFTRRLLAYGMVLTFLLIIPFSILAYDQGASTTHWLKHSAQHRMEIWKFAAEKSLERPLFGHGFDASRFVPNGDFVSAFLDADKPMIPLHPHDGFLQVWLELGAVGAVIVGGLMLTALNTIGRWPAKSARFALGGYAAGIVVAGLAFGIWQTWWMATLAFSAVAFSAIAPGADHI